MKELFSQKIIFFIEKSVKSGHYLIMKIISESKIESAVGLYAVKRNKMNLYKGFIYSKIGAYYKASPTPERRALGFFSSISSTSYSSVRQLKNDIDEHEGYLNL